MPMRIPLAIFYCFCLSSCAQLPEFNSPKATDGIPTEYGNAQYEGLEVKSGLLSIFSHDSELSRSISLTLQHNPDLQVSAATLEEAGYDIKSAKAGLFPSIEWNSSAERTRSTFRGSTADIANYRTVLDANWEVDVWGRLKAVKKAANYDAKAIEADYHFAKESLIAQTMQAYFNLVETEKLLALAKRRLVSFKETLNLVNRRFEAGVSDLGEVDLARTDVEMTNTEVGQRQDTRDQAARSLAVLTGSYPSKNAHVHSWPSLKRSVKSGIPSDLLMKRPDIDAAYQRIRAADSRVKVAHRDLYPSFSLTASAGRESSILGDLADANFNVWSVVGSLSAPLLNTAGRKDELGAANARAKQALADYQSVVLNAFEEVENALGSERLLVRQQESARKALAASRSAEERVRRNYESGIVEILSLLDTQRRSFDAEESLISITSQRYSNRVTLALSLGKGL